MSISVTQRPSTTISGETSRWNGVKTPIVYKFTTTSYAQPNYRLDVYVFNAADTQLNADPVSFIPDGSGNIVADIQSVLKANTSPDFTGTLNTNTEVFDDSGVYLKFYIKYQEVWTSSAESLVNDSANQFFAIYGSMRVPSTYGGNFAEYVSFDDGTPASKLLTRFDTIKMWSGWPCLVSMIVGDGVSGTQQVKTDSDATSASAYAGKVITVDLNEIITTQTVENDSIALYKDGTPDVLLSEELPIELDEACENPVLLIGRNKLGGMMSWMFDIDQDYSIPKGAKRKVLKASNLTLAQWEGLHDFFRDGDIYKNAFVELTSSINKTSSQIGNQVYAVDEDGNKTGVIVIPTSNSTRTRQTKHYFEIEIEYPEEW